VTAARILSLLLLLALAVAPMRMFGGEAAAMPDHRGAAMAMEHCAPDREPASSGDQPPSTGGCMMACAALPAMESRGAERLQIARTPDHADVLPDPNGIIPEEATPPPRAV
jgi:hypothetical protein